MVVDFVSSYTLVTLPISMTPHRMEPVELQELKSPAYRSCWTKGLLGPSTSPWGAPVLFAKKKDKTLQTVH